MISVWNELPKSAKVQFLIIIALVFIIPVTLTAVLTRQYFMPRAAYPVTPIYTSTPRPTTTPTASPSPKPTPTICNVKQHTVSVTPQTQSATAGSLVAYKVTVTNNDSLGCTKTTFRLKTPYLQSGWTARFEVPTLTVAPQTSESTAVFITSPVNTSAGSYELSIYADTSTTRVAMARTIYKVIKSVKLIGTPVPLPTSSTSY